MSSKFLIFIFNFLLLKHLLSSYSLQNFKNSKNLNIYHVLDKLEAKPHTYRYECEIWNLILNLSHYFVMPSFKKSSWTCSYSAHQRILIFKIQEVSRCNLKGKKSTEPAVFAPSSFDISHLWLRHIRLCETNQVLTFFIRLYKIQRKTEPKVKKQRLIAWVARNILTTRILST